ncbi:MAG TPA: hypothetical protein VJA21_18835 [Verrucomicrobiae bacterium]
MKMRRPANVRRAALLALGVFLGRGAQADTILEFDNQTTNQDVSQSFGDYAAASSDGVSVVGFGTPNIGLTWQATGPADAVWQYYNDSVWSAAQLNDSTVGSTFDIVFTPNNPSARVVVESFNFHPYYNSSERFTYKVSLLSGATVVSGPTNLTFLSDSTKNHPITFNYTGALGQTLKLKIDRLASTLGAGEVEGDPFDIAVDDVRFAQLPETVFPAGPLVVSTSPADGQTGVAAVYYPYQASITNGETTLVASSIRLRFDGSPVSPPAAISSGDGVTNVSYLATALLGSGSTHTYTLTYDDNLGLTYTNEVQFTAANYATLPAAYANPPGSGVTPGFTFRTVLAPQDTTNILASSIARARAQLAGTLIDPSNSLPYTNAAPPGPNADGSYNIDTVLNYNDNGGVAGNFGGDLTFPGLDFGPYDWFSCEGLLNLELAAGYYRLGVNSDDGFEVDATPPPGLPGSPIMLGIFDNGRAAADTLFDFLVPTAGVYPFQLIYFESQGSASCEFFSVADLATGEKILINEVANPSAIKSYRVLKPRIVSIARSESNAVVSWVYGTPPFQVQFTPSLTNPAWNNVGSPTTSTTANVPIQPGAGFIRVSGQ